MTQRLANRRGGLPWHERTGGIRAGTCLLGLLAATVVLALGTAAPASALLVHLKSGKEIGYQPLSKAKAPSATPFDSFFSNLDYSGGPVMPSNTNVTIVWKPSNYSGTAFQSDYVSGVNQFFTDLAHDSGQATNSDSVSAQYNDASGNTAAYSSSYGGTYTDTDPLPSNGCGAGVVCLTDAQLQSELDAFLASKHLPRDMTHEYFLLTPPDLVSCFDAGGTECSGNATTGAAFCAYHSMSATASPFIYANIPDMTGVYGCDPYVTFCPSFSGCDYPNGSADGVLSAVSHEHNESTTDPEPNNAWTDYQSGCSGYDQTCGGEIGDKCNGDESGDPGTNQNPQPDGNDAPYNATINGRNYWLQPEWSNQTHSCVDSWASNGHTASASFTQASGSGDVVNFDATASTATGGVSEYVWQFNDYLQPGAPPQNYTVETTSANIQHTFPQGGVYEVALTVMGADGTSNGTAHNVSVGAVPSNNGAPTIGGYAQQDHSLTELHGSWTNNPTSYTYQWEDCDGSGNGCVAIPGATAQTYTARSSDVGHTLRVQEIARNAVGAGDPASSAATATVLPAPPANVSPPAIAGTAQQGQTLVESHGSWTNNPAAYGYHWEDCDGSGNGCVAIPGATGQTYTLQPSDVGHTIRVQEAAVNAGGSSGLVSSAATAPVAGPPSGGGGTPGSGGGGGTASPSVGVAHVSGSTVRVPISCAGGSGAGCSLTVTLSVVETLKGGQVVAVTAAARKPGRVKSRRVVLGSVTVTLGGGQTKTVQVSLNKTGRQLLAKRHSLRARLVVGQAGRTISAATVQFRTRPVRKH